jgi:ribosomal protein S14
MISLLQYAVREKTLRSKYKSSESIRRHYKFMKLNCSRIGYSPIKTLDKVRLKNYCLVSGSARSIYSRKFRLSRHNVKRYFAQIKGLRIASW